ncbi:MAG TPA: tyrosine-type recombinase/integrase [Ktedonobacteraceae bacterium]|nr:tyrosine-type recombinase/integrase [Ktedonobacteraceae bacterium]
MSDATMAFSYRARQELVAHLAPRYREAKGAHKTMLLDAFIEMTGYARKYAISLLNRESQEGKLAIVRPRLPTYGPEVQQALFLAWRAALYICPKRLVPFLPTLLPSLEQHGRLHLDDEQRRRLLSMSAATAERLLRTPRTPTLRGLSTTKAGKLLKHQIPIRTFAGWENTQPGFLEADLVAHCGGHIAGSYLYTLTLTDVATGWTECLPLLARTSDQVLHALERARTLFPFPILGLDTDNGSEFINEELFAYCERAHLTFTRGRPEQKNDQCFVEEKNRSVVRHLVGYDRLVGEHACRQLAELYRALHLYVNCFQPSMKLVAKQQEGDRVRCVYDPAKTPLQRLLLSGVLPASRQQKLSEIVQRLDPLALVEQVERLQHAVFRCAVPSPSFGSHSTAASLLRFSVEPSSSEPGPARSAESDPAAILSTAPPQMPERTLFLNWQRSSTNPFADEREQILVWVCAHPERSTRDLFEELQRLFPGRYQESQYPALQRIVRKIRAHQRKQAEEPWPIELIHGPESGSHAREPDAHQEADPGDTVSGAALSSPLLSLQTPEEAPSFPGPIAVEEEETNLPDSAIRPGEPDTSSPVEHPHRATPTSPPLESRHPAFAVLTIDQAIQSFLQERHTAGREDKTLIWHQTALRSFQQSLAHQEIRVLEAMTPAVVRSWLAGLCSEPLETGAVRTVSTINAYARSARAFCHWLVRKGMLARTPFVKGTVPRATAHLTQIIQLEEFEQLLEACGLAGELMDHATARNRALLWLFWETGLLITEVCCLHLADVDREQGQVRIQGPGAPERWVPLGANGLQHLLWYLDQTRLIEAKAETGGGALFLSEKRQPLTSNAITLLLRRLSQRIGITRKGITASLLRDTFAVRYLQQGGHPKTLQMLLGFANKAALKRYQEAARSLPHNSSAPGAPENLHS